MGIDYLSKELKTVEKESKKLEDMIEETRLRNEEIEMKKRKAKGELEYI